jgi:hypothetical protein
MPPFNPYSASPADDPLDATLAELTDYAPTTATQVMVEESNIQERMIRELNRHNQQMQSNVRYWGSVDNGGGGAVASPSVPNDFMYSYDASYITDRVGWPEKKEVLEQLCEGVGTAWSGDITKIKT